MMANNRPTRSQIRVLVALVGVLCASVATVGAMQGVFNYVKAMPTGDEVTIQWQSSNENGVESYEIERRGEDSPDFRRLSRVDAKGSGSIYSYVDDGAFYKSGSSKRFTYRLKAVGGATQQFSPTVSITHEVSSVRKSWGMIKELFR